MKVLKIFLFAFFMFIVFLVPNVSYADWYCKNGDGPCWNGSHQGCYDKRNGECTSVYCCCGRLLSGSTSHNYSGGTCQTRAKCTKCGASGSYGSHSYSRSCSQPHCSGSVCKYCGKHSGSCGGGHTYTTCSKPHCSVSYCTKCGGHSCSGDHSYTTCSQAHCGKYYCTKCGHSCGGGHAYSWVASGTGESQTHINKCYKGSNCSATNGSHTASWQRANTSHTSTCAYCNLQYTHTATWSNEVTQNGDTHIKTCTWHIGCNATQSHNAVWGEYYKAYGGANNDDSAEPHTRKCNVCGVEETYHEFTNEKWNWVDTKNHKRVCSVCGLGQILSHDFNAYEKKNEDSVNHSELYKHWKICTTCDTTHEHREVDEVHTDNGEGICSFCGQILWKAIQVIDGEENITEKINSEENAEDAFREAVREEKIKIVENTNGTVKYIQNITGPQEVTAENNILTITENGEYTFYLSTGSKITIVIDNISRDILIDKLITPMTSTTGDVTILVRTSKSEEKFNKKIYIEYVPEGQSGEITSSQMQGAKNPYQTEKVVTNNGIYNFIAKDTAGNTKEIEVRVDNIIKGQATVAISNDVFVKGYIFTDILINPEAEWSLDGEASSLIIGKVFKAGSTDIKDIPQSGIKKVKVMDIQRNEAKKNTEGKYLPGSYYVQVAIGGNKVFTEAGTYIVDLQEVRPEGTSSLLKGRNRIIVEVQDLKDIT